MTTGSPAEPQPNVTEEDSAPGTSAIPPEYRFSLADDDYGTLYQKIHSVPVSEEDSKLTEIEILGAAGQHCALMRLNHPVRAHVKGKLGDYAYAFNAKTDIRMTGKVGHGVAEGMIGGAIRIRGDAGQGAGVAMTGGTLAIYGSAGHRCGAAMRGGGIFVRGNVGDDTGRGALGGMIVIGGNAGEHLGDATSNVTIFIRGDAKGLAAGVIETPLRKREQLRLGLLLIKASIRGDATEFRRVIPEAMYRAEQAQNTGEVTPNWR